MIGRRGFITGLISLVAAPAIVRAGSLMPVKVMVEKPRLIVWGDSFLGGVNAIPLDHYQFVEKMGNDLVRAVSFYARPGIKCPSEVLSVKSLRGWNLSELMVYENHARRSQKND